MMPSTLPRISYDPAAALRHFPSWTSRERSPSCRARVMISATIISATLRVLENGALNTGTPRRLAPSRSTWLVPMQKQPTVSRRRHLKALGGEDLVRGAAHVLEQEDLDPVLGKRSGRMRHGDIS